MTFPSASLHSSLYRPHFLPKTDSICDLRRDSLLTWLWAHTAITPNNHRKFCSSLPSDLYNDNAAALSSSTWRYILDIPHDDNAISSTHRTSALPIFLPRNSSATHRLLRYGCKPFVSVPMPNFAAILRSILSSHGKLKGILASHGCENSTRKT